MLPKFSVKKPYTIVVAVIIVLILGSISFINLQTDLLPELDLPYLVISTSYPGASPEEVEMTITKPIEQIVARISNIKNINSISSENSSIIIMEFNNDVNMDSVIIEVNGSLDLIKDAWDDTIGSPMIIRLNPDMLPIMISSVDVEDMDVLEISNMARTKIIPELESVTGLASVDGIGLLEEKIEISLNQKKIDQINKNVLDKLDGELSEVENKLNDAKKEIEEGKRKIDSEENVQLSKLRFAEDEIKGTKKQMEQGKTEIDKNLKELKKQQSELRNMQNELTIKEKELLNSINIIDDIPEDLSPEVRFELDNAMRSLAQIEKEKQEIRMGITTIESAIKELEGKKTELKDGIVDLNFKERDISNGKLILSKEIDKARSELKNGEIELNRNLEEFEHKKDEAFKSSSLEGVIDKDMISNILMAQNFSMPAGYLDNSDFLVKIGDKLDTIDEIKDLLLFDTGKDVLGKIRLSEVADVKHKDNSDTMYAKVNGNNAVILNFQKQSNYSISEVSKNINDKMQQIMEENNNLSFTNLMDQGIYIDIVVKSVLQNIAYGGALAIIILILFLKDIKPTFIIAVSIPISVIFAIAMMYFSGVTINIISLAGLALGVGMLVDNSIVVIENIYRLRSKGMSRAEASIYGAKEVSGAIIASTLTTACVFLPIVFTKGISRQLFSDMGLTIAYSLFASLIVALTLVPAMSSNMLKIVKEQDENILDKLTRIYEKILQLALNHRGIVMIVVSFLLVVSGYLAYNMGTSFIPEMEAPQMHITLTMPDGSSFEDTIGMSDKFIQRIVDIDGIETIGTFQANSMGGPFASSRGNNSNMNFYILLDEEKTINNSEIVRQIKKNTHDLDATIIVNTSNMDMTALGGKGIEIVVRGREIEKLIDISNDVEDILKKVEGIDETTNDSGESAKEIRIIVDKEKAMENGLTTAQVFSKVNDLLSEGKKATDLTMEGKDYPVIVMESRDSIVDKNSLLDLKLDDKDGNKIKMKDIAEVKEQDGLSSITREQQQRYVSVKANLKEGYNIGLVSRYIEKDLKDYKSPDGYDIRLVGENETINNSLRDLTLMLMLSITFIYLIMVAQFQSLLSPFIVMFTIPLAFTGGILALWLTGNNISLVAMLGFLVLSGVTVNNGIVFVDYVNQLRQQGIRKRDALILTGKTRLRPILMTAITTILGLTTLAFGVGMGAEMLQPLAIVAIGGLVYATILTLIVVPVMYDFLNKKEVVNIEVELDVRK